MQSTIKFNTVTYVRNVNVFMITVLIFNCSHLYVTSLPNKNNSLYERNSNHRTRKNANS